MDRENSQKENVRRGYYRKPVLLRIGEVRDLTQAGLSGQQEAKPQDCNPNANSKGQTCG